MLQVPGFSCQSWVGPTVEHDVVPSQVSCISAAKERHKGIKPFRPAKPTRGNRAPRVRLRVDVFRRRLKRILAPGNNDQIRTLAGERDRNSATESL